MLAAGDYFKFGFPMAVAVTNLAWGLLEFKNGYMAAGQYEIMLDSIKWPLDYFIKCHIDDDTFVGQVTKFIYFIDLFILRAYYKIIYTLNKYIGFIIYNCRLLFVHYNVPI